MSMPGGLAVGDRLWVSLPVSPALQSLPHVRESEDAPKQRFSPSDHAVTLGTSAGFTLRD